MPITNIVTQTIFTSASDTPAVTMGDGDTLKLVDYAGIFATGTGKSYGISAVSNGTVSLYGAVVSSNSNGFYATGGGHKITIASTGSLFGGASGINIAEGGNSLTNAGSISAASSIGVLLAGTDASTLVNSGQIRSAGNYAVYMNAGTLTNTGTIETGSNSSYAVEIGAAVASRMTNSGTIIGAGGIDASYALTLTNTGTVTARDAGNNGIFGSNDRDIITNHGTITGGSGSGHAVDLYTGDDTYDGRGGHVKGAVFGNDGNDTITGGADAETLSGGADNDTLDGGAGADTLIGGTGNDIFYVDTSRDVVLENAGEGSDRVYATASYVLAVGVEVEILSARSTASTNAMNLTGNEFSHTIQGNAGTNRLAGGTGADTLFGGLGNDLLTGRGGNDSFRFNTGLNASTNVDHITDFSNVSGNNDTFKLDHAIFAKFAAGQALVAGDTFAANATGTANANGHAQIVYNTATGTLSYDTNGSASGGATVFAVLDNHASLTVSDFVFY